MAEAAESASLPTDNTDSVDAIADLLTPVEEEVEEVEEETEATDEVADDSEEEETPSDESTEESEGEVEESWESILGVEEEKLEFDEDGTLAGINVKVDGTQATVKMDELIAGYQSNKSYTQKSQALAEERKEFETKAQELGKDYQSKIENIEIVTNYLSNKLVSEFEGINWEQLRAENPAEYAALKQDYSERAKELQQAQSAVQEERQTLTAKQQAEQNDARKAFMTEQFQTMLRNNPQWENEAKRNEDMGNLKTALSTHYNFQPQDFDNVSDARIIEVIKDAVAYREGAKMIDTKTKKRPVPKFQKSTGRPAKRKASKLDTLTKAAKKAKGANKRTAQTDAVAQLLTGGI